MLRLKNQGYLDRFDDLFTDTDLKMLVKSLTEQIGAIEQNHRWQDFGYHTWKSLRSCISTNMLWKPKIGINTGLPYAKCYPGWQPMVAFTTQNISLFCLKLIIFMIKKDLKESLKTVTNIKNCQFQLIECSLPEW